MPPLARAVEPEHTVSRSRTITRPAPSRARWYAVLTPMMPAPTITTSAVSVMAVATIRQLRSALNDLDAAHDVGATLHRELGLDAQGLRALRLPVDLLETFPRWRQGSRVGFSPRPLGLTLVPAAAGRPLGNVRLQISTAWGGTPITVSLLRDLTRGLDRSVRVVVLLDPDSDGAGVRRLVRECLGRERSIRIFSVGFGTIFARDNALAARDRRGRPVLLVPRALRTSGESEPARCSGRAASSRGPRRALPPVLARRQHSLRWRVSRRRGRYDLGERHAAGSDGDRGARDSHGGARRRGRRPRRHRLGSVRSRSKPDGAVWAGVLPHRSRRGVAGTHRSRRSADDARRRPAPRPRAAGRRARSPAPHAVAVSAALARARADRARVSRGGMRADVDASGLPGTPGGLRVSGCRRPGAADARRTGHAAEPGQRGRCILQRLAGDEPRPAGRPLSTVGHPGTRCGR